MKRPAKMPFWITWITVVLSLFLILLVASNTHAAGLLTPIDGSMPPLQITDHQVRVTINNGFAVTEVDQRFFNPNDVDLEAIYTFPLPKNASLSELTLWIDGQEVVGEVVEKEKAREIYEKEKKEGNDTALAEKREYISFDVFISPVRAGSETRVRLVYLQPLEIDLGVGRYVYPLEEGGIDEEVHTFWDRQEKVHNRFSFEATVRSAYPIEEMRVKGYDQYAQIRQEANDVWTARIEPPEGGAALDQDIVLYYMLDQNLPGRVDLLAHRDGGEPGTFLIVITPGVDLQPIREGVDWSIVLDISGSMDRKLAAAAEALSRSLGAMRPEDRFRIVVFSDDARFLIPDWTPISPGTVQQAREALMALETESSTNVYAGLQLGIKNLEEGRTAAVILVSDGGANVGPKHYAAFRDLLAQHDVRVFTFVMGQGANRPLLERMAETSGGFSMDVSNRDDLYGRIMQAKAKLGRQALHGIEVELDGVRVADFAPREIPSAYYGQQITLFGRYRKSGATTLRMRARISGEEREWETSIVLPEADDTYPELERLWALARIQDLDRKIQDTGKEGEYRVAIVDLGTEYSIVTDYTSMVVVREEKFEEYGLGRKNRGRVETERLARQIRVQKPARVTRADKKKPMFGNRPSGGIGAFGPLTVTLLGGLLGAREYLRRRRNR